MHNTKRTILNNTFFVLMAVGIVLFMQIPSAMARYRPRLPVVPTEGLGRIVGKITGDLKAVKGVRVLLIKHDEAIDEKYTDEDGVYVFQYLDPACYDIKGMKDGYRTHIITHIPVDADHLTRNDFYLPKYNNDHMSSLPLVEKYQYPKRYAKDLMREDDNIVTEKRLSTGDE